MSRIARFVRHYLATTTRAGVALTVGLGRAANRALMYDLARRLGYREHPPLEVPRVHHDEVAPPDAAIVLPAVEAVDGNVTLLELTILARLVRAATPKSVFEIGTFDGRTTLALAANAPDAKVYTLDLPAGGPAALEMSADDRRYVEKPESGGRFKGSPLAPRITQLWGDSATFDFAPYRADFIFVDGAHSYEYVLSDSARAMKMLNPGGTIVWHDYGEWEGVTRALNELARRPEYAGMRHVDGTTLVVLRSART